ncbi:hypothetical protein CGH87_22980 [Vibrio parahaemolyticus]|uniref:hypothetical protein n=1 Tax=Vibrio sp. 2089 TaxID=3074591 RepID=UPI000415F634|nr:hypothetical protein [Vibrio sp. 2089]EGR3304440.1 hypothetical protein [Vibrio parahaemolyticus]MDW1962372.1 hypothetical protein [Vibrio sp. 661]EGR3320695.1 hypothetical protein [Vibrio parahaemolyticus]KHF02939.1 hypothetical protein PO77_23285 [Vibrio parahaemolyticus]MDW2110402.1 hypothetical protein [Vibrio sp. 2089]
MIMSLIQKVTVATERCISYVWFIASVLLMPLVFLGYGEAHYLIYLGFSVSGVLQWKWRYSVWPALRKKHT